MQAEALAHVVLTLERQFAPKGSKLIIEKSGSEIPFGRHEGLGLFLNGTDLDDTVYAGCAINHVITECNRRLGKTGAYRGYWQGDRETALYFYGTSYAEMERLLVDFRATYPLCEKSRIEQVA